MFRDYIATGFHGRPLQYAENYYLHYPKVAIGHWPPVFYLMQAAWTLVFSASHTSVLLLMAAITVALALILFREITYRFNIIYGIAGGLLFICLPVTQDVTSMIMADSPVGLFSFLAIIHLTRFLDKDRWQDGCWYGIWCCAAILSKGNGWAAPFAMPVAILLTRQFRRLLTVRFWIPAAIVVLICGPYHLLTWKMIHQGWRSDSGSLGLAVKSLPHLSWFLVETVGLPLFLVALAGFVRKTVVPFWRNSLENYWASMTALMIGFIAMHAYVFNTLSELRYYITVVPCVILFLMAGVEWLLVTRPVRSWTPALQAVIIIVILGGAFAASAFYIPLRPSHGFAAIAQKLLQTTSAQTDVTLVSSSGLGEGMLIAQIADHEKRPSHIILRASKQLASSTWDGSDYGMRFHTPAEVMHALDEIPVTVIVVHTTYPPEFKVPHHELLLQALAQYPQDWGEIASYEGAHSGVGGAREVIKVYRLKRNIDPKHLDFSVDLSQKLNKVLHAQF